MTGTVLNYYGGVAFPFLFFFFFLKKDHFNRSCRLYAGKASEQIEMRAAALSDAFKFSQ